MPLDAFVFCHCFETNNLRGDPPGNVQLKTEPWGDVTCSPIVDREWSAFQAWKRNKACMHYGMILIRHRLGTSAEVELLRAELNRQNAAVPILQKKVLYSATHTCDWIPLSLIPRLSEELKSLAPASGAAADALQLFKIYMAELISAAQYAKKPICF
jgi:hypothetical protein